MVDTETLSVKSHIEIPARIPTSCGFMGEGMDHLAVTTADYGSDLEKDPNAGFTVIQMMNTTGRVPYLFG